MKHSFLLSVIFIFYALTGNAQSPGGVSSNLLYWFKAGSGTNTTTDGASVTSWTAANNGAISLANSGTVTYLNNGINFNPIVSNTGTGYLTLTNGTSYAAAEVINVSQLAALNQASYASASLSTHDLTDTVGAVGNFSFESTFYDNTGLYRMSWQNGIASTDAADKTSKSSGVTKTLYPLIQGASLSTNTWSYALNGGTAVTQAITGSLKVTKLNLFSGLRLDAAGRQQWTGYIPEVILYSSALTATERKKVNTYLAIKYGITMTDDYIESGGTTIWDVGGSGSYDNDITIIGRDDTQGLNQKQSTSTTSTSNIFTVGLGTIATDNASNANTHTDDSYLVIGSNSGSTAQGTMITGPNSLVGWRMNRIFKTAVIGTVGTVTIASPSADASWSGSGSYRYLVVSSDATFNGSDTYYILSSTTVNSISYYATTVTLTNGQFFTFANHTSPLPLSFISFTVKKVNDQAILSWQTTSEINCKNFEIEYSADGTNWELKGEISANNNFNNINKYSFSDKLNNDEVGYYRIKQIDLDGKFTYSIIRSIHSDQVAALKIDPNPANDYINLINLNNFDIEYSIIDMNGKIITEAIIFHGVTNQIMTTNWESGTYIVRYTTEKENTEKIIIRH